MRALFDKLRQSLVFRVTLIYAAVAWAVVEIVNWGVGKYQWGPPLPTITAILAGMNFLTAVYVSWIAGLAPSQDRRFI